MRADSKEKKGDGSGAPTPISMFERADAVVREMARLLSSLSVSLSLSLSLSSQRAQRASGTRARDSLSISLPLAKAEKESEREGRGSRALSHKRMKEGVE
jgi:hypothetical protein